MSDKQAGHSHCSRVVSGSWAATGNLLEMQINPRSIRNFREGPAISVLASLPGDLMHPSLETMGLNKQISKLSKEDEMLMKVEHEEKTVHHFASLSP